MKKACFLFFFTFLFSSTVYPQSFQCTDTIKVPEATENVFNKPLYSDSLASSFFIAIKKEVKPHLHLYHSEHVYFLQGSGEMKLGEKIISVKKGDVIFIPQNTVHSLKVTSNEMVKIISVQAPFFDGKDRVFVEEEKK